jgi:hypothetical protein
MRTRRSRHSRTTSLPCVNPHAAGLDIGCAAIWACVPEDRDAEPVRPFGTFTPDLYALALWLTACRIETLARSTPSWPVRPDPKARRVLSSAWPNSTVLMPPLSSASSSSAPGRPRCSSALKHPKKWPRWSPSLPANWHRPSTVQLCASRAGCCAAFFRPISHLLGLGLAGAIHGSTSEGQTRSARKASARTRRHDGGWRKARRQLRSGGKGNRAPENGIGSSARSGTRTTARLLTTPSGCR